MLKQTIHNIWSNFKSWFDIKKRCGILGSNTLKYQDKVLEVDLAKIGFLFSSCDITNTTGKLTISQEFEDEKTEMFDVICMVSLTKEDGMLKLTKTVRRFTFYRNSKGRLVNITMGPPKFVSEEVDHS